MIDKIRYPTLPQSEYAANDVQLVTFATDITRKKDAAGQAEDVRLLKASYDQLFDKKFTKPDERVEFEDYKYYLLDQQELPVSFSILVQHKGKPDEKILGLEFGTLYPDSRVGLHTYLARQDGACVQGTDGKEYAIGIEALRAAQKKWFTDIAQSYGGLRGLVSEAEIPGTEGQGTDGMNPDKRLRLMRSYGGQIVPIDYYQAALGEGKEPLPLVLLSYPIPGTNQRASNEAIADWLKEFHTRISALENPLEHFSYTIPAGQVAAMMSGKSQQLSEPMQHVLDRHAPSHFVPPSVIPAGSRLVGEQIQQAL